MKGRTVCWLEQEFQKETVQKVTNTLLQFIGLTIFSSSLVITGMNESSLVSGHLKIVNYWYFSN